MLLLQNEKEKEVIKIPKCLSCYRMLPPNFLDKGKCLFCIRDTKEIDYFDKNNIKKTYLKEDCIKDYELFLKKLSKTHNLSKILTKGKNK